MDDRHHAIHRTLADFFSSDSQRLRRQLNERLGAVLHLGESECKRIVRELIEERLVESVSVCYFNRDLRRVVIEPGLAPGPEFHAQVTEPAQVLART